jgi:hypothetical protein
MNYQEWLMENHPEFFEGFGDWAKKAAVGAALMGAGVGIGRNWDGNPAANANNPAMTQQSNSDIMIRGDQAVVIGRARISNALGPAGMQLAQKKAKIDSAKKLAAALGKTNNGTFSTYGTTVLSSEVEGDQLVVKYRIFLKPQANF